MDNTDVRLLYVVTKNKQEAQLIAHNLVGHRLVACANIIDSISSVYRWQGEVVEDNETLLILKTRRENVTTIIGKIKEIHSYEVPAMLSIAVDDGFPPYLQWLKEQCT